MRETVLTVGLAALAVASGVALAHNGPWTGPWDAGFGPGAFECQSAMGPGPVGYGPGMMRGARGGGLGPQALDLTDAQREKLAAVRAESYKQMEKVRAEARERMEAILTPEQRGKLRPSSPGR